MASDETPPLHAPAFDTPAPVKRTPKKRARKKAAKPVPPAPQLEPVETPQIADDTDTEENQL